MSADRAGDGGTGETLETLAAALDAQTRQADAMAAKFHERGLRITALNEETARLRAQVVVLTADYRDEKPPADSCSMIAPICADCGREIDKTPAGWVHVLGASLVADGRAHIDRANARRVPAFSPEAERDLNQFIDAVVGESADASPVGALLPVVEPGGQQ